MRSTVLCSLLLASVHVSLGCLSMGDSSTGGETGSDDAYFGDEENAYGDSVHSNDPTHPPGPHPAPGDDYAVSEDCSSHQLQLIMWQTPMDARAIRKKASDLFGQNIEVVCSAHDMDFRIHLPNQIFCRYCVGTFDNCCIAWADN